MTDNFISEFPSFGALLYRLPQAAATLTGSPDYPGIKGKVRFYQTEFGVLVVVSVQGLPHSDQPCSGEILGFHIHEGASCTGEGFEDTLGHYNPSDCPHPRHAGDLPPLFVSHGYAFSVFLTDRFSVSDVIGRTVLIHSSYDDFTTQPAGNSGTKIACGEIKGL